MSTFLFLLIRSLQILRSSANSFAVHCSPLWLIVNLRNRTGEERRRQTLCDKRDDNFFEITFHQTSLSFKHIFL